MTKLTITKIPSLYSSLYRGKDRKQWGGEVIHRQSVHVSARKSIDIFRRVQLARARERAKDRKWIFRNVIFPAEGNEARARVCFSRILHANIKRARKEKRREKEKQSRSISHLLSILVSLLKELGFRADA